MPKFVVYSLDNDYHLCSRPIVYREWPDHKPVKSLNELCGPYFESGEDDPNAPGALAGHRREEEEE